MKSIFWSFLLLLFLIGCQNENKLTFETQTIENDPCSDCPLVSIEIPKVLEETTISKAIKRALKEELISILSFDDGMQATSIKEAITSFNNGYQHLQKLYDDEPTGWEAKIKGSFTYEDETFATIMLESYLYTGGAHGYTSIRFLNFDKIKGIELDAEELFENTLEFSAYAEDLFRKKEGIPLDKPINYTGFMFERDSFYLPENIGFTEKGLKLLYNPYEVASFADGVIELNVPHKEVKKYLVKNQ
jgi:hypothetical protein